MINTDLYPTVVIETSHRAGVTRSPVPTPSTPNLRRMLYRLFLLLATSATASLVAIIGLLFYGSILSF